MKLEHINAQNNQPTFKEIASIASIAGNKLLEIETLSSGKHTAIEIPFSRLDTTIIIEEGIAIFDIRLENHILFKNICNFSAHTFDITWPLVVDLVSQLTVYTPRKMPTKPTQAQWLYTIPEQTSYGSQDDLNRAFDAEQCIWYRLLQNAHVYK